MILSVDISDEWRQEKEEEEEEERGQGTSSSYRHAKLEVVKIDRKIWGGWGGGGGGGGGGG